MTFRRVPNCFSIIKLSNMIDCVFGLFVKILLLVLVCGLKIDQNLSEDNFWEFCHIFFCFIMFYLILNYQRGSLCALPIKWLVLLYGVFTRFVLSPLVMQISKKRFCQKVFEVIALNCYSKLIPFAVCNFWSWARLLSIILTTNLIVQWLKEIFNSCFIFLYFSVQ